MLEGFWNFLPAVNSDARQLPDPLDFKESLVVPGVWETAFRHFRHRGQGWYQKTFCVNGAEPSSLRLVFEAVSHTAKVWVDREYLGQHYGAHTQFEFTLPALRPGQHEILVWVDNTFGPHNPLSKPTQDIYTYGGITRPVFTEELPSIFIQSARAVPVNKDGRWKLNVHVRISKTGNRSLPRKASIKLEGKKVGEIRLDSSGAGSTEVSCPVVIPWSPENPRLYFVRIECGEDCWQERIGFRTIRTEGRKILLNDRPLTLCGVNRHEFHPDFGPAVPAQVHLRDIEILKELNANFVRGSHYPNDPLFLDLCDEHGILFWEELSHWQPSKEDMDTPEFRHRSLEQIDEMVNQHRHHPSIILWGMLNEAETNVPVAREVVELFAERFRLQDPTRLVTFASFKPDDDVAFDLVDVVSLNFYPGWYSGDMSDLDERVKESTRVLASRSFGKPLIYSEFGAGAMEGVRSIEMRKWTENFQAELLKRVITFAQDSQLVSGVAIWQYCDVRTSSNLAMGRIREYNNKGIVTEYREPKLAFHVVQEIFKRPWKKARD